MNRLMAAAFTVANTLIPKSKRRVVFCSFPDYADNARALYEQMLRQGMGERYRISWLVTDPSRPDIPADSICQHSLKGIWRFLRAGCVFHTHGLFHNRPGPGQRVVSLWHGMPLKTIMKLDATHPKNEVFRFTCTIATSPLYRRIMAEAFACGEERCLITGQPRCDELFHPEDLLLKMGIRRDEYRKVFLWMPTYRKSVVGDVRADGNGGTELGLAFLTGEQLAALNETLAELDCLMLIKLHPMQAAVAAEETTLSHIRILRQVPGQLYSLVGQADALLTDCSSVYVDYLMLDRPIGFVFDDMDQYTQNRGFVFLDPIPYMPGPFISDADALAAFLRQTAGGEDGYADSRQRVREQFHTYCDGESSRRVIEEVFG